MLLVILGAGASYDSVPTFPAKQYPDMQDRLSLANELFEFGRRQEFARDVSRFPQCRPILPYLENRESGLTVEHVLQRLQNQAAEYPERNRQLAAIRYYLSFAIFSCEYRWDDRNVAKATNQITLLDQIEQWRRAGERVCLVTFNYDLMLETALSTVGVKIQDLDDYITSDSYKLIKLHGSVNWAREVDTTRAREVNPSIANTLEERMPWPTIYAMIDNVNLIDITQDYRLLSSTEHPSNFMVEPLFPAIAIPVETKSDYECPAGHVEALYEFVPEVDKILVIGWRAAELHFLQTIAADLRQDIKGLVVAGSSDEANETIERLKEAGIRGEYKAFGEGFTDFIVSWEAEQLLKS